MEEVPGWGVTLNRLSDFLDEGLNLLFVASFWMPHLEEPFNSGG